MSGSQCPHTGDTAPPHPSIRPLATQSAAADQGPQQGPGTRRRPPPTARGARARPSCSSPSVRDSSTSQRLHHPPGSPRPGILEDRPRAEPSGAVKTREWEDLPETKPYHWFPNGVPEGYESLAEPGLPPPLEGRGDTII